MRSYLVLIPPNGPDKDHRSTLILRDGFSWTALLFPGIWLLGHKLWLAGIGAILLQGLGGFLMTTPGLETAGGLLGFAIHLLAALEARHYRSEALIKRGWTLEAVIPAPDLDTAEEIYFTRLPKPEAQPIPAASDWAQQAKQSKGWSDQHLGLFDYEGGR